MSLWMAITSLFIQKTCSNNRIALTYVHRPGFVQKQIPQLEHARGLFGCTRDDHSIMKPPSHSTSPALFKQWRFQMFAPKFVLCCKFVLCIRNLHVQFIIIRTFRYNVTWLQELLIAFVLWDQLRVNQSQLFPIGALRTSLWLTIFAHTSTKRYRQLSLTNLWTPPTWCRSPE